jgi:hypothetical protein
MVRTAIIAGALAIGAPSEQFDLVCKGQAVVLTLAGKTTTPYRRTLRIDLTAEKWCAEDCATVDRIASVEPSRLLLRDVKRDTPREYWIERESVDRVTGAHSSMASDNPHGANPHSAFSTGSCEKAPFTGLEPAAKKF